MLGTGSGSLRLLHGEDFRTKPTLICAQNKQMYLNWMISEEHSVHDKIFLNTHKVLTGHQEPQSPDLQGSSHRRPQHLPWRLYMESSLGCTGRLPASTLAPLLCVFVLMYMVFVCMWCVLWCILWYMVRICVVWCVYLCAMWVWCV